MTDSTVSDTADLTDLAIERWGTADDPRLAEIMQSLVTHLHGFARDVRLREDEWFAAVKWLTSTGQISSEKREEFILASDVLGLSMLVVEMNHAAPDDVTPATVVGPFHIADSPPLDFAEDMAAGIDGTALFVHGTVAGTDGQPIVGAQLDVWQADADGAYEVQLGGDEPRLRGIYTSRDDGSYCLRTISPRGYSIPMDGPVGDLIGRTGISEFRPAHVHFKIDAPGYESVTTHLFQRGSDYLDSDVVFGTRPGLVVEFVEHEAGDAVGGATIDRPWLEARYDFVLQAAKRDDHPETTAS